MPDPIEHSLQWRKCFGNGSHNINYSRGGGWAWAF
jgi:hypothetical protein